MSKVHYKLASMCVDSYSQHTFVDGDVEILYKHEGFVNYFAIRGTEASAFFSGRGWMDILRDLRFWPNKINNATVHAGFLRGYNNICDYIEESCSLNDHPVVFTGHSMGGAIALIAAYDMMAVAPNRLLGCVTFGAPRCINWDNVDDDVYDKLKKKVVQFQHVGDIVPGFLGFTSYEHIDSTMLPYRFSEGERWGYFSRDWKYHRMNLYRDLIMQRIGS